VGQTCLAPGDCKNTYGTGCFLLMNTGPTRVASQHGLLTTVAYQFAHDAAPVTHYALEGSVAVGGALIQWLRDNLGVLATAAESETLAATVPDSGGVIIVPAFSGLFAPWWRADARGLIIGLTRHTTRAHLARAALDATCFQTCDVLAAMNADARAAGAVGDVAALKVDGGMTGNALLLQLQADLLGVPVVRPVITETTALGVAFAAGLAAGVWRDAAAVRATWREAARFAPAITADERARRRATWRRAVERSMGWLADGAGAEPS
jgi:glycerol kinase